MSPAVKLTCGEETASVLSLAGAAGILTAMCEGTLAIVPEPAEPSETGVERAPEGDIHIAHVQHTVAEGNLVDVGVVAIKQRVGCARAGRHVKLGHAYSSAFYITIIGRSYAATAQGCHRRLGKEIAAGEQHQT